MLLVLVGRVVSSRLKKRAFKFVSREPQLESSQEVLYPSFGVNPRDVPWASPGTTYASLTTLHRLVLKEYRKRVAIEV